MDATSFSVLQCSVLGHRANAAGAGINIATASAAPSDLKGTRMLFSLRSRVNKSAAVVGKLPPGKCTVVILDLNRDLQEYRKSR